MGPKIGVAIFVLICTVTTLTRASDNKIEPPFANNKPRQPHIIFILADDMGFNDIGYHNLDIRSPNLDELASQGVRLENYYVQPTCGPTRASLMSGRYTIHTGLQHLNLNPMLPKGLPLDSPTLADKMREAGYATHIVGKWHLGFHQEDYLPTRRGFDSFLGLYTGSADHYTYEKCLVFCATDLHNDTADRFSPVKVNKNRPNRWYSTNLFTRRAVEIIEDHQKENSLFLYLPYTAVHGPIQVPDQYRKMNRQIPNNVENDGLRRRTFAGMVTALDKGVARVVDALKEQGMWDNTILVFSSDNGGSRAKGGSNYPLRGGKGHYWEGGIRAVGFVTSPLLQMANYVNSKLMHVTDWYPTLVRLAGGNLRNTKPLDGYDQWDTISENASSPRTVIVHNIDPLKKVAGEPQVKHEFDTRVEATIRVGEYKLLTGVSEKKQVALFNLRDSPTETRDLSSFAPWKIKQMLDMLQTFNETAAPPWALPEPYNGPRGPRKIRRWEPWL